MGTVLFPSPAVSILYVYFFPHSIFIAMRFLLYYLSEEESDRQVPQDQGFLCFIYFCLPSTLNYSKGIARVSAVFLVNGELEKLINLSVLQDQQATCWRC